MKALLIIACVLLLLILPLLLNLKLFIRYENEKFFLSAGILFFVISLFPKKKKRKKVKRNMFIHRQKAVRLSGSRKFPHREKYLLQSRKSNLPNRCLRQVGLLKRHGLRKQNHRLRYRTTKNGISWKQFRWHVISSGRWSTPPNLCCGIFKSRTWISML